MLGSGAQDRGQRFDEPVGVGGVEFAAADQEAVVEGAVDQIDDDVGVGIGREPALGDARGDEFDHSGATARRIVAAVESPNPPLRLPLGRDAVAAIRAKLTDQLAELDEWEQVAVPVE
jgi:hypothetical protein